MHCHMYILPRFRASSVLTGNCFDSLPPIAYRMHRNITSINTLFERASTQFLIFNEHLLYFYSFILDFGLSFDVQTCIWNPVLHKYIRLWWHIVELRTRCLSKNWAMAKKQKYFDLIVVWCSIKLWMLLMTAYGSNIVYHHWHYFGLL